MKYFEIIMSEAVKKFSGLTPAFIKTLQKVRHEERIENGGGGACHLVSEWLEWKYGWDRVSGTYTSPDYKEPQVTGHYWNLLPDGSILDATADQLGEGKDIIVVHPSDRNYHRYRPEFSDEFDADYSNDPEAFEEYIKQYFPHLDRNTIHRNGDDYGWGQKLDTRMKLHELSSFENWFAGSKVVDKNGNPLRMYHVTKNEFENFAPGSHFGTATAAKHRFNTLSPKEKKGFERKVDNFRTYPVYLSIKNPLKVQDLTASDESTLFNYIKQEITKESFLGAAAESRFKDFDLDYAWKEGAYKALEKIGYDGVVYKNNIEDRGKYSWVIFHPDQVRFALSNMSESVKFADKISEKFGVVMDVEVVNGIMFLREISRPSSSPKGNGAKAIMKLCQIADTREMRIQLCVADGEPDLVQYYNRFGFLPFGVKKSNFEIWLQKYRKIYQEGNDSHVDMSRVPENQITESYDDEEDFTPPELPETVLPAGTTVYHGTGAKFSNSDSLESPCWVTTSFDVAKRFVDWHQHSPKGKRRILQYVTTRPLTLLQIDDRETMNNLDEYHGVDIRDPHEMAEGVLRIRSKNGNRFDGWVISGNYHDGDDIMLGDSGVLSFVKTKILKEGVIKKDHILELIKAADKKFGFHNLSGGNCGTLVLGLGKYLAEIGQDFDFFLIVGDNHITEEELEYGDYDLEHVMLHTLKNGKHVFYDATGCIGANKISQYCKDFHNRNYGNGPIKEFWLDFNEKSEQIIRCNTDYSITATTFYTFFKTLKEAHHEHDKLDYKTQFAPLKKGDSVRVFHGFYDVSEALTAAKHGLSGAERADRRYSYEFSNNPKGLFVTMSMDIAKEFTSKVVMEFVARENQLEAPVWPGGGYTVQGGMEQYFSHGAKGRAERAAKRREMQGVVQGYVQKDPEHLGHVGASDDPYKAYLLMTGREYQALYIGHLDPSAISAFWVSDDFRKDGKYSNWTRMTVEQFIERFNESDEKNIKSNKKRRIFLPNEEFDPKKFMQGLQKNIRRDDAEELMRDIVQFYLSGDTPKQKIEQFAGMMEHYLWPKQFIPAIRWILKNYSKKDGIRVEK